MKEKDYKPFYKWTLFENIGPLREEIRTYLNLYHFRPPEWIVREVEKNYMETFISGGSKCFQILYDAPFKYFGVIPDRKDCMCWANDPLNEVEEDRRFNIPKPIKTSLNQTKGVKKRNYAREKFVTQKNKYMKEHNLTQMLDSDFEAILFIEQQKKEEEKKKKNTKTRYLIYKDGIEVYRTDLLKMLVYWFKEVTGKDIKTSYHRGVMDFYGYQIKTETFLKEN